MLAYRVANLGQAGTSWQLLQPYGGWGYTPPPPAPPPPAPPAGTLPPLAPGQIAYPGGKGSGPVPPPPPTNMGYATDIALANAYNAYKDAVKSGSTSDIDKAFTDYKNASQAQQNELPLRDQMEQMLKQERDLDNADPRAVPDAQARQAAILQKMEDTWPGWLKGYLDLSVAQSAGTTAPAWYRNLVDQAQNVVNLALQVLPLLPALQQFASQSRPWVQTWGRSPTPAPAPVRPPVATPFQDWWKARNPAPPPVPTLPGSSATQMQQRNAQWWRTWNQQNLGPTVATPSGGGQRTPTTVPFPGLQEPEPVMTPSGGGGQTAPPPATFPGLQEPGMTSGPPAGMTLPPPGVNVPSWANESTYTQPQTGVVFKPWTDPMTGTVYYPKEWMSNWIREQGRFPAPMPMRNDITAPPTPYIMPKSVPLIPPPSSTPTTQTPATFPGLQEPGMTPGAPSSSSIPTTQTPATLPNLPARYIQKYPYLRQLPYTPFQNAPPSTTTPPPSSGGMPLTEPQGQPTGMGPSQLPGGTGGCPPGMFPGNGGVCRGSIASGFNPALPGGLTATGAGVGPAAGGGMALPGEGALWVMGKRYKVVNL